MELGSGKGVKHNRLARACGLAAMLLIAASWTPWTRAAAADEILQVPPELWDRPRSGRAVMAVPAVRQAVRALLTMPEAKLAVRHPPGAESTLQAEELRAWLVAHAVEPGRIALRADLPARHALQLDISR